MNNNVQVLILNAIKIQNNVKYYEDTKVYQKNVLANLFLLIYTQIFLKIIENMIDFYQKNI